MAWVAPANPYFNTGDIPSAATLNVITNDLRYLKGLDGAVAIDDRLTLPVASGTNGKRLTFANGATDISMVQGLDAGAASRYLIFGTNRYYDGSAFQQLNTSAGSVFLQQNDALSWSTFPASSNTATGRLSVTNVGWLGLNQPVPAGPLHVANGASGGFLYLSGAVSGSLNTLAPAGTVAQAASFWVTDYNAGTDVFLTQLPFLTIAVGASTTYVNGDTITVAVTAGGAITFQRTVGSNNHNVNVLVLYI
jgi:hypothetical protein